jgi:hypothetical protein
MSDILNFIIQETIRAITPGVGPDGALLPVIPARAAPVDYNGTLLDIDMSNTQDYTSKWGKIVIDGGNLSLRGTIIYRIWCAQGCPVEVVAVTAEHLRIALEYVRVDMARWQIYKVLVDSGVIIQFRPNDLVRDPNFTAAIVTALRPTADRLHQTIIDTEGGRAAVADAGYMILLSMFANAIHRANCHGHNWYTNEASKSRSNTRRCLFVAGQFIDEFSLFMEKHGHDTNHHLTTECLSNICDVISGLSAVNYPDVDVDFGGRNIRGMPIPMIFPMPESATDRWPATQLGKSAMIVALDLVNSMYTHLSSTLLMTGTEMVASAAAILAKNLKTSQIDRTTLRSLDGILSTLVSTVFGYCAHVNLIDEERYMALKKHAERQPAIIASGKALAIAVMKAVPHKAAVNAGVKSALANVATTLSGAATEINDTDAEDAMEAFDASSIVVEAGKDEQVNLIELLKAVRSGGNPNETPPAQA